MTAQRSSFEVEEVARVWYRAGFVSNAFSRRTRVRATPADLPRRGEVPGQNADPVVTLTSPAGAASQVTGASGFRGERHASVST